MQKKGKLRIYAGRHTKSQDEHETAGNILKELRSATDDYKVPDDACPTYADI